LLAAVAAAAAAGKRKRKTQGDLFTVSSTQ